jgi:hypothetical protein
METPIQDIIADPTLSTEAKVILVTGEIEKQIRNSDHEQVEIRLMCEDVPFHPYHAPFIPRVGDQISCRLEVGKGHFATLWHVKQVVHEVGLDRLFIVTVEVEPADTQTAMHWRRFPKQVE